MRSHTATLQICLIQIGRKWTHTFKYSQAQPPLPALLELWSPYSFQMVLGVSRRYLIKAPETGSLGCPVAHVYHSSPYTSLWESLFILLMLKTAAGSLLVVSKDEARAMVCPEAAQISCCGHWCLPGRHSPPLLQKPRAAGRSCSPWMELSPSTPGCSALTGFTFSLFQTPGSEAASSTQRVSRLTSFFDLVHCPGAQIVLYDSLPLEWVSLKRYITINA